jgi:hypothetical protein
MPRQARLDAPGTLHHVIVREPNWRWRHAPTFVFHYKEHRERMGEVLLSGACADVSGNEIRKYLLQFLVETQEFLCLMIPCLFNDD